MPKEEFEEEVTEENSEEDAEDKEIKNKEESIAPLISSQRVHLPETKNSIVLEKIAEMPNPRNLEENVSTTTLDKEEEESLYSTKQKNEYSTIEPEKEKEYSFYDNSKKEFQSQRIDPTQLGRERDSNFQEVEFTRPDYSFQNNEPKSELSFVRKINPTQLGRERDNELREIPTKKDNEYKTI